MLSNHLTSILRNCKWIIFIFFIGCASSKKSVIQERLYDHSKPLKRCYQREIKVNDRKELKGNVILDFTINKMGKVESAKIQNSYWVSGGFKRCILSVVKKIDFPKPKNAGKVKIIQPINFYPKDKK